MIRQDNIFKDTMKRNSVESDDGDDNNNRGHFFDALKNVNNFDKIFSKRRAHLLAQHRRQISCKESTVTSKRTKTDDDNKTAKNTEHTGSTILSDDESDIEDESTLIDKLISKPSKPFDNDKYSIADNSEIILSSDDSDIDTHQQLIHSRKPLKRRSRTEKHIEDAQGGAMVDGNELNFASMFNASLDDVTNDDSDIIIEETSPKQCTLAIEDFENGGPEWIVNWKMNDDLSGIAQKYATKWQCSKQCVRLSTKENDTEIPFDKSPQQLSFAGNGITQLLVRQMKRFARPEDNPNIVKIVFQSKNGKISKWIPKSEPLLNQTSSLISELGLEVSHITFLLEGSKVNDVATPESLEIESDDIIDIQCF